MKILALEFSSPRRSVAVVQDTDGPRHEAVETGAGSNKPFELIEQVLGKAGLEREQIDGLAVGLGPGSYNGIRAAIAIAQGWQLGREVKLHGISSADCVAAQAYSEGMVGRIAVVIDAQRGEFYLANYELTVTDWQELQPLRLVSPNLVAGCEQNGELLVGPEVTRWFPHGRLVFPQASTLGKMALIGVNTSRGQELQPIYLRQTSFVKAPPPRILPE
jgi:tRNA threonylcarbamoyladenosine biosynthesis protein TsaB